MPRAEELPLDLGSKTDAEEESSAMAEDGMLIHWKSEHKEQLPEDEYKKLNPVGSYVRRVPVPASGKHGPRCRLWADPPPRGKLVLEVETNQIMGPIDDRRIGQGYATMRFLIFCVNVWQNGACFALPCDGNGRSVKCP